jgi:FtsZ-binding cell division protein ZapB
MEPAIDESAIDESAIDEPAAGDSNESAESKEFKYQLRMQNVVADLIIESCNENITKLMAEITSLKQENTKLSEEITELKRYREKEWENLKTLIYYYAPIGIKVVIPLALLIYVLWSLEPLTQAILGIWNVQTLCLIMFNIALYYYAHYQANTRYLAANTIAVK